MNSGNMSDIVSGVDSAWIRLGIESFGVSDNGL